jgi:hypothetical protein
MQARRADIGAGDSDGKVNRRPKTVRHEAAPLLLTRSYTVPRIAAYIVSVCLVAPLVSGCSPGQRAVEQSIVQEMKSGRGVEITAINLTKQGDGSYTGTATAANGDTYEVVTEPPKGGQIRWEAIPDQTMIERHVRSEMDAKLPAKVVALSLTRKGKGVYEGTAELANGFKYNVSTKMEGTNLHWEYRLIG